MQIECLKLHLGKVPYQYGQSRRVLNLQRLADDATPTATYQHLGGQGLSQPAADVFQVGTERRLHEDKSQVDRPGGIGQLVQAFVDCGFQRSLL